MPTNLPPQAQVLWLKAQEAKTPGEKLDRLQEFLSAIPAHKGTEKLRHQVRHQIAVLRDEIEEARIRRKGTGVSYLVEKEGAFQAVLVGVMNSGKSTVFNMLTGSSHPCSAIGYETSKPVPGMMRFQDVNIQMVDTPSITGTRNQFTVQACASARNGDLVVLVLDGTQPFDPQLKLVAGMLENFRVHLRRTGAMVKIEKRTAGGVQVVADRRSNCSPKEVSDLLKQYGLHHALVVVSGPASLDDVEASIIQGSTYKPSVCVVTKLDLLEPGERARYMASAAETLSPVPVLDLNSTGFEQEAGRTMFDLSGVIRVYTKPLNQRERSARPIIMHAGDTVEDVVKTIHSSMLSSFQYAKVWGTSVRFQGSKVGLSHGLRDGDTIEVHA